jgi:protein TonB
MAILLKHVNDDPPWPSKVPVPLLRAVHKALAKDPAERWSSAGAFAAAMEAGLGAGTPPRIPFVPRRRIAIAAGALAIAVTVFLTLRDQPRSVPALLAVAPPPPTIQSAPAVAPQSTEPTPPGIPERPRIVLERPTPKRTGSPSGVASAAAAESGDLPRADPLQTVPAPIASPDVLTASNAPPETSPPPTVAEFVLAAVERVPPDDVLAQPIRIKTVAAAYPPVARAAQIVGNVVLHATVGLDGAVSDVAVVRSVHPLLDQAAKQAVLQYRYTPAMRNAVPEVGTVEITVSFRLE